MGGGHCTCHRDETTMKHFTIRRIAVTVVAVGVLGTASPAFAAKPANGTVGRADQKAPAGQTVNDRNRGYECDANSGVGRGNPAHSSCSIVVVVDQS